MLNKKQYNDFLSKAAPVEAAAAAIVAKCNELGLTPTTDINQLREEYKTQLFAKLIAVDKGLKHRYEMHRTDRAKLDLINAHVSLDGYHEIEELQILIAAYNHIIPREFNDVVTGTRISAEDFLVKHKGSVAKALEGCVIDVTDTDLYRELQAVADALNSLYARGVIDKHAFNYNSFYKRIERLIPASHSEQRVNVSEEHVYYYLREQEANKK